MHKTIKELEDYLVMANYSLSTRKSYVSAANNFYKWCLKNVNDPDFDKSQAHRLYLVERSKKGLAWQTVNGDYSAIRMLYTKVLGRQWDMKKTPGPGVVGVVRRGVGPQTGDGKYVAHVGSKLVVSPARSYDYSKWRS